MKGTTALVAGVTVMFCTAIAGVTLVAVFAPADSATILIGQILAALATTVVGVLALAKVTSVGRTVDDLANGTMDAKIRAGVADVLASHLIDPEARPQLEHDRQRRGSQHGSSSNGA